MALIVDPEDLARRLKIPLPLTEDARYTIEAAIADAQTDVEAYLGRPIEVTEFTEYGLQYVRGKGFRLKNSPVVQVISVTAELVESSWNGLYTVVYRAGLDAATDRALAPIRRFVAEHAKYSPDVQALARKHNIEATRKTKTLSVTGQSIGYEDVYSREDHRPGSGAPGALPTLESLATWRIAGRRVFIKTRPMDGPWPYGPNPSEFGGCWG